MSCTLSSGVISKGNCWWCAKMLGVFLIIVCLFHIAGVTLLV